MADTLLGVATLRFAQLGYFIVFFGSLAEGLSLPFPSIILLIMAGAAVATGRMSFWAVTIVASLAYTMGAVIPYYIGANLPRLKKYPWAARFAARTTKPMCQMNELFAKHGSKIVALSRPFLIGNCISYVAGLAHMPPVKFVAYTFVGILPWATAATLAGLLFGANLNKAVSMFTHYFFWAFGAVLVAVLLYVYVKQRWFKE
jgi:membrane protein DedA with SNARE-associated domain